MGGLSAGLDRVALYTHSAYTVNGEVWNTAGGPNELSTLGLEIP